MGLAGDRNKGGVLSGNRIYKMVLVKRGLVKDKEKYIFMKNKIIL